MNDSISRQAAIDAVNNLTYPSSLVDVKRELVDLPSAYPKKGKWVEHVDDRWGASHYSCSECGEKPLKEERTNRRCLSNFCPYCGARMDKDD